MKVFFQEALKSRDTPVKNVQTYEAKPFQIQSTRLGYVGFQLRLLCRAKFAAFYPKEFCILQGVR